MEQFRKEWALHLQVMLVQNFHLAFNNVAKSLKKVLQMRFDGETEFVNVEFINNCSVFLNISFISLIIFLIPFYRDLIILFLYIYL